MRKLLASYWDHWTKLNSSDVARKKYWGLQGLHHFVGGFQIGIDINFTLMNFPVGGLCGRETCGGLQSRPQTVPWQIVFDKIQRFRHLRTTNKGLKVTFGVNFFYGHLLGKTLWLHRLSICAGMSKFTYGIFFTCPRISFLPDQLQPILDHRFSLDTTNFMGCKICSTLLWRMPRVNWKKYAR